MGEGLGIRETAEQRASRLRVEEAKIAEAMRHHATADLVQALGIDPKSVGDGVLARAKPFRF